MLRGVMSDVHISDPRRLCIAGAGVIILSRTKLAGPEGFPYAVRQGIQCAAHGQRAAGREEAHRVVQARLAEHQSEQVLVGPQLLEHCHDGHLQSHPA